VSFSGDPALVRRTQDERPERIGDVEGDAAILEIPAEHPALRASDPETARSWRDVVADAAQACLYHGLFGAGFLRDRSAYVFARTYGRDSEDATTP
jgi:predicted GNAT superfamily acetyltransferase